MSTNWTEEQISIINGTYRITSIMGVPGCGKTTTLFAKLLFNKLFNILVITRTNSVVEEIIGHALKHNMIFDKITGSKHYIHQRDNGNYISITNIDAFIHYQLTKAEYDFRTNNDGDNFIKKKKLLEQFIQNGKIKDLYIKNNDGVNLKANQIYIDEVQDMIPIELSIFIKSLKNNKDLKCSVFGDTLQTLTEDSTNEYPIIKFNKELNAKQYNLSLCFRCPKSHTRFNNILLQNTRGSGKYGDLPNINSNNEDLFNRPFVFTHPGMGTNSNGYIIADYIINIIKHCREDDSELNYGDISILVPRINECASLPIILSKLISELGDNFHYFETKSAGKTIPIDFNKIKEIYCECIVKSTKKNKKFKVDSNYCDTCKTHRKKNKACIISIDAFKGKESKLIIALNLAEKSIPRENHIDKKEELTDWSKLNVLTTRSTKYLFLGINEKTPSRYFMTKLKTLEDNNLIYHPWFFKNNKQRHLNLFKDALVMYKKIAEYDVMKDNKYPKCIHFPKRNTPDNSKLSPTDISDNIDIEKICNYRIEPVKYGKKCNFDKTYDNRIVGNMGNLLIFRKLYINGKVHTDHSNQLGLLQYCNDDKKLEIDSEQVYSIIVDLGVNKIVMKNIKEPIKKLLNKYHNILDELLKNISKTTIDETIKKYYNKKIGYLISSNEIKLLYHSDYYPIFENIKQFQDRSIQNEDIDSNIYFNIAILIEHLTADIFRPVNKNYIDIFKEDISILHHNCNITTSQLSRCYLEQHISFSHIEKDETIIEQLGYNKQDDKEIFIIGYPCSLVGISDIICDNNLIEIKTSTSDMCNKGWVTQVLLYHILNNIKSKQPYNNIYVNNILDGHKYKIIFDKFDEKKILIAILNKYKFIDHLRDNFIDNIFK